jgi:type I restriction-modification system DNA methylase subunit
MPAPKEILELVERFKRNRKEYESGKYNETQLRREFLDPFFKALGWDIANERGRAEAYKEVIHEDAIKIGAATKAPDYCFRVGGTRKFFLEAKKPSINIKDDLSPAFQLRRYAWSAKLPLSILSDFEEFAVYDCRVKPYKNDKSNTARLMYFTFDQYVDKWDGIASIFSQEAVLDGSFDRFADSSKGKKGTTTVDEAFLEEIEKWRNELAKNIAFKNSKLTVQELNFSVQKIIDRIIFLRISEDRGIEQYGKLLSLINGTKIYDRLTQYFQRADERYNSGLFHFRKEKDRPEQPDELTLDLKIDDKVFKDMIGGLYYPESPYEFSALPADILGQVYEQFLGKVIRLTDGHQAKVEDKPEVKKAGGVFYTPTYIVEYIVRNTIGKLCEGKNPKQVSKLRILDPACGSGSFLIGAYQYLLDWHRDWFVTDGPQNYQKELYQGPGGDWRLTTDFRKKILLNNIYGVDIDPQAVEVSKLSLLLKVLEGESEQTLKKQLEIFHQRALPDLGSNVKCGNSLVGPDYFGEQLIPDIEEMRRVNSFDWKKEFTNVNTDGGFNCVIGNPPYIRQEMLGEFKEYFKKTFNVYHGSADIYTYFIEKGISLLAKNGLFGIIVANKWMRANYGEPLRKNLKTKKIIKIIDFGDLPVFETATTYPCVLVVSNSSPSETISVAQIKNLQFLNLEDQVSISAFEMKNSQLDDGGWSLVNDQMQALVKKLEFNSVALGDYTKGEIFYGIKTGDNEAFVIDEVTRKKLISEDSKSKEIIKPFLAGRDIKRYQSPRSEKYLIFTRRGIDIKKYPAIEKYLLGFKEQLLPKPKNWKGKEWKGRKAGSYQWYEIQDSIDYFEKFEKPKIIVPAIVKSASYALDETGFYSNDKTTIIATDDLYLLGLLNSKVLDFVMHLISSTKQGGFYEYKPMYLVRLPIKKINLSNAGEKKVREQIANCAKNILSLNRSLSETNNPPDVAVYKRQIDGVETEINKLVYKLYELTAEEIKMLESGD